MTNIVVSGLFLCMALCALLGWQILKLKKSLRKRERKWHRMHQDLYGLIKCMRGISQRFEKQQKQLRNVTIRQNDIRSHTNINDSHYEQAVLLMDKGATVEELIKTCGLSIGEAELMNRISTIKFEEASG